LAVTFVSLTAEWVHGAVRTFCIQHAQ